MSTILVVTEIRGGQLKSVSFEAFTAARQIADETGRTVTALFTGSGIDSLASHAGEYGVDRTLVVDDPALKKFSPDQFAEVIAEAARKVSAEVILMGASFMGKDLMARAAFLLKSSLAQDCVSFRIDGETLYFTRPMYAGKILAEVSLKSNPVMATLRPKAVKAVPSTASSVVESMPFKAAGAKAVVDSIEVTGSGKLEVTEADIIVSGGRGMKGPDQWHIIEDLATTLGAATGCSRPVSDEGWRPHEEHIGQTGKTVSPSLYIAAGISGAIQHIAGMSSSKYIVAINKDPEAPIFKVADYGIVGDVFEVLPAMNEAVKKLKAND